MSAARRAVRCRITGRVQRVGYRAWTAREAAARGLGGWVRNQGDGSVEAVFAGPAEAVEAMLAACRRGPAWARVDGVEVSATQDPGPAGFEVRRGA